MCCAINLDNFQRLLFKTVAILNDVKVIGARKRV